jgi:hypothetical protein
MNNYEHVICFEKADGTDKSYYVAREKHDALQAQLGDRWRWLAPKSITQGFIPETLSLALIKPRFVPSCGDEAQVNSIRHRIGRIRPQESEKYVEFSIWVGALPTSGNWKQFALQRDNGEIVISTFKGQQTSRAEYMKALKEFYESFPYTKVLCDVNGSKMRVRIWEKQGVFMLADEGLSVRLGKSSVSNSNNPLITRVSLGAHTYAAQNSYQVKIGDSIQEGNKFTLDSVTYIAVAGDSPETVRAKLLTGDRYFVPAGSATQGNAVAGTRIIANTNKMTVQASFDSVSGGNDRYKIMISGSPQPGNVIQVSAPGKTTKSYTVVAGDTISIIAAVFNTDSGFYTVSSGVIPQTAFLAGNQEIINQNFPALQLTDFKNIPSYNVNRWQLIIGSDVKSGNSFTVKDQTYTAKDGDSALNVAGFFGYDSVSFQVETAPGVVPAAYATKGFLYNESNIADVNITEGPKLARSSQYVVEAEFGCDIEPGSYRLGIVNDFPEVPELIALGNFISVKTKAEGEIFEVSDYGDVFGFEYYENGLSQRLRLPVFINPPMQKSEEERVVNFMGGYRRTTTKKEFESTLVTRAGHLPLHITIASFLKHEHVRIGEKVYYNAGEYSEVILDNGTDFRQATTLITETAREKNNFQRYRSNYYQSGAYGGFCKLLSEGVKGRLQLWLRSSEIVREIEDWQLLNTASYQLSAETFENVNLTFYQNGNHYLTAFLPKGQRIRLAEWLKLETGTEWIIKASISDACYSVPTLTYACEQVSNTEITYDCKKITKPAFGEFSNDFNPDYTI